jgi:hypothetical protein
MATFNLSQGTQDLYSQFREYLTGAASEKLKGVYGGGKKEAQEDISRLLSLIGFDESPKQAFASGIMNIQPGYLASNFRTPQQIQALRKMIAEEMRSRGSVSQVTSKQFVHTGDMYNPEVIKKQLDKGSAPLYGYDPIGASSIEKVPDPIDQILRGSWYHGMSSQARDKTLGFSLDRTIGGKAGETPLMLATERGFPQSLHDTQSISNKLGEPAGVSISMLPTKAKQFSADEYIHRVLPQSGGSPMERTVNLMTSEGRKALNDAYDVVANKVLFVKEPVLGSEFSRADIIKDIIRRDNMYVPPTNVEKLIQEGFTSMPSTGPFNQQLSSQLQSSGYRGILYNPKRWDEYEMLMFDPKYVLPLDYRKVGEYASPVRRRVGYEFNPQAASSPEVNATPGIQRGLSQIQDDMAKNASRLGDIYSERPWSQRLSTENKNSLLELIDERYRESVGNQLFGGF